MPRRVTGPQAVAEVAALAGAGPRFVGVDGLGGAGKSTLAGRVAAAVPSAVVVGVDGFSGPDVAEWDWHRLHAEVVAPLLAGRPARYRPVSWTGEVGAEHVVPAGALVVVEGVSSTRAEADVPWALTVWVDAPPAVRRARVHRRDGAAMAAQWERWLASEEAYLAAQRPHERADLLVDGVVDGAFDGG